MCEFAQIVVRFSGCSIISTGFSIGSNKLGSVWSPFFNLHKKNGKFKIPRRISSIVLVFCRNRRPIKGLVRFVVPIDFSLNVMPPILNCNSTVAKGAFKCPLATVFWYSGRRPWFSILCRACNWICVNRFPEWHLRKHSCLWTLRCLTLRNPLENITFFVWF